MQARRNPKDSMKSTWRRGDRSEWTLSHRLMDLLGLHHVSLDQEVPVHSKQEKVPYMPSWHCHRYILVHACMPLLAHHAYVTCVGRNLDVVAAFLLYGFAVHVNAIREVHILRRLGHVYGFFDGDKHARDGVPDVNVKKVLASLLWAGNMRPMLAVILSYRRSRLPSSISWVYLPFEIALYGLAVDFWFYWYHRTMHEVDFLWRFHRTHHLTKHPNALLTLYADGVQEVFDIVVIPLLAFVSLRLLGFPMGFYETWLCNQYLIFTEILGHSGLRVYTPAPSPLSWLYTLLDAEGTIEDHDLHHRKGWRDSHSYSKHARIWDRLFGTTVERIECAKGNIDHGTVASFPLF